MSSVSATIEAPVSAVWAALVDPDTYPDWLIGARRIRRVEDGWPRPGTSFHHVVGLGGPLSIADRTTALEVDRKSVVEGKSGSVRVDLGGRRIIKKKIRTKIE